MRKSLLLSFIVFLIISGCGQKKREETVRGRLKYVVTERWASAGGHGYGRGWVTADRQFYVDNRGWSPAKEFNLNDFTGDCEPSPNERVEAFKCYRFSGDQDSTYIVRMNGDKPQWEMILSEPSIESDGKNFGEWFDDGRQLLFTHFAYNFETGEKREVKGVPDFPVDSFRAVSPDLKTIVFQGTCFNSNDDRKYVRFIEFTEEVKENRNKICAAGEKLKKDGIEVLWLIEAETGATGFLKLRQDKYPWLVWINAEKSGGFKDWRQSFQKQLVWKKDETGRDRLVFPN